MKSTRLGSGVSNGVLYNRLKTGLQFLIWLKRVHQFCLCNALASAVNDCDVS